MSIIISGGAIPIGDIARFEGGEKVKLGADAIARVKKVRAFVDRAASSDNVFYGINTGFGMLANKRIPHDELEKLQENLILSHAVGVGDPFSREIVRLIMLLRANVLAQGYSGIRLETLSLLVEMLNRDIVPIIPQKGSVGASGDLAPLAHLALAMIGRGDVWLKGVKMPAAEALRAEGLSSVKLAAKEGIALINGTQAMAAMGAHALLKLENLLRAADIIGALSVEGDRASVQPFDERIHKLRPHPGQLATAANIRSLLAGSSIIASHADCTRVQDPYSFRCIPQVHGAVKDAVAYARGVILCEIQSCTDNPLIFVKEGEILSGGNFHGEPLALAMDTMGMAVAELGSISERRVAILTAPLAHELSTKFLTRKAGLNSGLMIPHVVMSALVSENKVLAHPACVDSVPTSGGQEDHVSMGTISARKALDIINNVEEIISIELFAACQAIDLQRGHGRPGKGTAAVHALVRCEVAPIDGDREFRIDMAKCAALLRSGQVVAAAEKACGELEI
ncbi:MAG: histidine ammonia-lyase [bacterium]